MAVLQAWEGYVTEIGAEVFVANLLDLTAGDEYDTVEAIIPLSLVSGKDADRMEIGSIFTWCIRQGKDRDQGVSEIVFRDGPVMTAEDWRRGDEWADKIRRSFGLSD